MANSDYAYGAFSKACVPTRKRVKGRRDRSEAKVKKAVRAACVARDGYCLVATRVGLDGCQGPSTWAHLSGHRRSQTRGMAATVRHDTRWTAMLCARHHAQEEAGKYEVMYRTSEYADGPIGWAAKQQKEAA